MQAQINNVKNELRNEMQTLIQALMSKQTNKPKNMMASFFQMNIASTSGSGPLPSNTIANLKGELKAITTRSGLVLDGPFVPMPLPFINLEEDERAEETLMDLKLAEYTIKVPPRLIQKAKPPSLRNYVVYQRDPRHPPVILKKLSEKVGDPRKFLIPCGFSKLECKALVDLGASIHLMPLSVWKKLGLPELISTRMTNELADRAICTPAGITRDVFVPVESSHSPLILSSLIMRAILKSPSPWEDLSYGSPEMDSILEDSVDECYLTDLNNNLVDTIPEIFTDEHTLDYSSPSLYKDVDDDLVELESDNDDVYDDPFDSKEEKFKESKLLIDERDPHRSSDFLFSPMYDSVLYEDFSKVDALPSTDNEDKVFNPAGSKSRPPMLNKENYVPWSSRLLQYAKSRPNGKLIHSSIINGPYVRRMILEAGDTNREVPVNETFHVQTDDELTEKELKQIEADDQAIQTILLGHPEDIYAAVDSCETAQEICNLKFLNNLQPEWSRHVTIVHQTKDLHTADYTQLYDFLKYNQKEVDELKAERLAKTQDPLALMATSNNPYNFLVLNQDQPSFNQNYMQQPMPNPEDITDPTTAMYMALALMAKAFKLNYSTLTNNNQRISSNPRNRQIAHPGMNIGKDRQMQMVGGNGENQFRQYAGQNVGNLHGYNDVQNVGKQNLNRNGNLVAARTEGNASRHNADLDEIEEVNANCILMANLQQASTSGTLTDKAPVYDSDRSAEVHDYENCNDNEIFNMFTQEEQYTELLEPILKPHQVPHNDNNVISKVTSMEQSGETVEQHPVNFEETCALYDSLYQNLAIEVEKVNSVNRKLKETNADLTIKLARFKNQEKCFEISQEKYDKLERYYQQSVYQEQCLSKKINALHLSSDKQIITLNEEILDLNKQLSKEKSTVSFLLEEKKKLKSDFKNREDELLDKQIQLDKKIKELNNILVKTETLQLTQESRLKMKELNKEIKPANYTKTNHLSGVFVSQMAKSHEELYFLDISKMANVSKPISIPNEEFLDDNTPSVGRKFLNKVKSTIVTLHSVVKHRMTLETHNWSSSAHQELHKIVKDEFFPIVNQVDARVQNFEIQFLKEAPKFVGDFKSIVKEADESLAKHKALELEIKHLLRAVVSQDIMSVVQKASVVDTSNLQLSLNIRKNALITVSLKRRMNMLNLGMIGTKSVTNANLTKFHTIKLTRTCNKRSNDCKLNWEISRSLPEDHMSDFHHLNDAREIWRAMKARFSGNEESKKMRKTMLKQEFSEFSVSEEEGLHKGYDRIQKILSQLNQMQAKPDNDDVNMKSLEIDVKSGSSYGSRGTTVAPKHSAFIGAASTNTKMVYSDQPSHSFIITYNSAHSGSIIEDVLRSFVAKNEPTQQLAYKDFEQVDQMKMKELEIKWQMAMLSLRINKFQKKA
nr:reverse transcriptase domain-containing protein [Tanacetum cinerariifolium]